MTPSPILWLALAPLGMGACTSIDVDYPRSDTTAVTDTRDTYLGTRISELVARRPEGVSGFHLLSDGIDALSMRLLLARRAERSIDLQYYLIKNDITGKALTYTLLEAADRGVRVRVLLDDMFTGGYDAGLAALDSHPNIEIRIYNPFYRGFAGRVRSGLTAFTRINRRMHNKSFTVDNQVTVVGGRNIADEYFDARDDARFGDLDVVAVGPVVRDVSTMFDAYWNHETALPIPAFAEMPEDPAVELRRIRDNMVDWRQRVQDTRYAEAVKQKALRFIESDEEALHWAPYSLVYDSPDKGVRRRAASAGSVGKPLAEALQSAERQVIIVSPYFVPGRSGVRWFTELQRRGVAVTVITNSLAANNQLAVHGGYAPSRKPLLEAGVRIYEVRPDADTAGVDLVASSSAKATLHTKAFLVDDREVFIGSFNFDPRSAYINTESGVIVRSPEIAADFERGVRAALDRQTYELFLNDDGRLRWRDRRDGQTAVLKKEPQSSWWQRFAAGVVRLLPIRSQL